MISDEAKLTIKNGIKFKYKEHERILFSILESHLKKIDPNKGLPIIEILEGFNTDTAVELNKYGEELRVELTRLLEKLKLSNFSEEDKKTILELVDEYCQAELYKNRFKIMLESIDRKVGSHGIKFDLKNYRIDIPKSCCEAASEDSIRIIKTTIANELSCYVESYKSQNKAKDIDSEISQGRNVTSSKPDPDFMRRIINDIANLPSGKEPPHLQYPDVDDMTVNWHLAHMIGINLLEGKVLGSSMAPDAVAICGITPAGHEFLKGKQKDTNSNAIFNISHSNITFGDKNKIQSSQNSSIRTVAAPSQVKRIILIICVFLVFVEALFYFGLQQGVKEMSFANIFTAKFWGKQETLATKAQQRVGESRNGSSVNKPSIYHEDVDKSAKGKAEKKDGEVSRPSLTVLNKDQKSLRPKHTISPQNGQATEKNITITSYGQTGGITAQNVTINMDEKAKPRILTPDQKKAILVFLANVPKGAFSIKANITVPDAWSYADQIAEPFRNSGWNVRLDNAIITGGSNVAGMWITIKNPEAVPPSIIVLKSALEAAGIVTRVYYDPSVPDSSEVWLSVGSR